MTLPRALPLLVLVGLLALPLSLPPAAAHLDNPLPSIQAFHDPRVPTVSMNGTRADVDLLLRADPPRHLLRYAVDPSEGLLHAEYRPTASVPDDAFRWQVALERVVEYRDVNSDLLFDPAIDAIVHTWALSDARWNVSEVLDARIDGVNVKTTLWDARLGSGPRIAIQMAAGGSSAFEDEGAFVMPQDVVLYIDLQDLPARGTGHLFAFDGEVRVRPDVALAEHEHTEENVTTAILARAPGRLAYLQWGGEAVVDGHEEIVGGRLGAPSEEDGLVVRPFRLSPPLMDEGGRFVVVFGMEYVIEDKRAPGFEPAWLVVPVAALALVRRLFTSRSR